MFFLFYLALGASVFSAIESPIEQKEIKDLIEKKKAFLSANKCIQGKYMIFQYARFLLVIICRVSHLVQNILEILFIFSVIP